MNLTPNGFGVVSNNNVAPASKERVERLIASLEADGEKNIELLIPLLAQQTQWVGSEQHKWFAYTLFPNLDLTTLCDIKEHRWLKYCDTPTKGCCYRTITCRRIFLARTDDHFA